MAARVQSRAEQSEALCPFFLGCRSQVTVVVARPHVPHRTHVELNQCVA